MSVEFGVLKGQCNGRPQLILFQVLAALYPFPKLQSFPKTLEKEPRTENSAFKIFSATTAPSGKDKWFQQCTLGLPWACAGANGAHLGPWLAPYWAKQGPCQGYIGSMLGGASAI